MAIFRLIITQYGAKLHVMVNHCLPLMLSTIEQAEALVMNLFFLSDCFEPIEPYSSATALFNLRQLTN